MNWSWIQRFQTFKTIIRQKGDNFASYIKALAATDDDKLNLLINRLDYTAYKYNEDLTTIDEAFA